MPKKLDLAGKTFDRLTALSSERRSGRWHWRCSCRCGAQALVQASKLMSGHTGSCGCLQRERTAMSKTTHGRSGSRLYGVWLSMRNRCADPKDRSYIHYGGRGITVCSRWSSFENFLADMGEPPAGMTLERKENAGNYSPNNCVWAASKVQGNNKRNNRLITAKGKTQTLSQWADDLGMSAKTLASRVTQRGWSIARAFAQPVRNQRA